MSSIAQRLTDLLTPVAASLDCELWGIEYLPQGRHAMLRVYIEKPDGVSVDDCERVSRQVSAVLDVEDPIKGEYTLEVSSPGMDRPLFTLDHYRRHLGEKVALRLRLPFEGRRKFSGTLTAVEDDEVILAQGEDEYLLPFELIDKANIVPEF